MAIRIREIKGFTIALCAAETKEKPGDLYLDDNIHHALTTKFGLDFYSEGFLDNPMADPVLVKLMKKEKVNVAISAHGNSMRPFRRHFEKLSIKQMMKLENPWDDFFEYGIEV